VPYGTRPTGRRDERQPSFAKGGTVFLVLLREEGQGLAEYALILSLIATVVVAAVALMGGNLNSLLSSIASNF
jgi:pilus assembly protein Flp/PilA